MERGINDIVNLQRGNNQVNEVRRGNNLVWSFVNIYNNAFTAFSLQDLGLGATNAVRVRRSSDNTEQDFTFAEITDGTLTSWVGAGNDGFVQTWYDQTVNANHAVQTIALDQPKIVDAGSLILVNGNPAIESAGNKPLVIPNSKSTFKFLHDGTSSNIIMTGLTNNSLGTVNRFRTTTNFLLGLGVAIHLNLGNKLRKKINGTSTIFDEASGTINNEQYIDFVSFDADNATLNNRAQWWINNVKATTNNTLNNTASTADSQEDLTLFAEGFSQEQEIIIFNIDQKPNRIAIQNDIANRYNITI